MCDLSQQQEIVFNHSLYVITSLYFCLTLSHSQKKSSRATDVVPEGQAEAIHLPFGRNMNHYGATRDARCPSDAQGSGEEKHREEHTGEGYHNKGYEVDEDK